MYQPMVYDIFCTLHVIQNQAAKMDVCSEPYTVSVDEHDQDMEKSIPAFPLKDESTFPESPISAALVDKCITKEIQQQNLKITKEARAAIENMAQLFLVMVATTSSEYTKQYRNRQTVQKADVQEALDRMGYGYLNERIHLSGAQVKRESQNSHLEEEVKSRKTKITRSNPSPYSLFIKQEMPSLKKEFPDLRLGDLAKEAAKRWHAMSADEKSKFR